MAAIAFIKFVSVGTPVHIYEGTLDIGAIPYNTTAMAEQDMTVTGIGASDILISFQCTDACTFGVVNARVKAANTVAIVPVATDTNTAVNPANTLNYRIMVIAG